MELAHKILSVRNSGSGRGRDHGSKLLIFRYNEKYNGPIISDYIMTLTTSLCNVMQDPCHRLIDIARDITVEEDIREPHIQSLITAACSHKEWTRHGGAGEHTTAYVFLL